MGLSIIFLTQTLLISTVSLLCLDLDILTTRDKYLQNNLLGVTTTVSLIDCAAACQSYQQCQSFGFEPQTKSCHLHGITSGSGTTDFVSKSDWVHGNLLEWPKSLWGPCADHICSDGHRCHVNRMTSGQMCIAANIVLPDDLCPVPPDVTNAALSTGGQKIGTSRTYTCNDEYLDTETFLTSAVITCLPDKTWSPVTLNCSGPYVKREIVSDSSYIFHNIEADVLNRLTGSTSSLVYLVKTCHDGNFLLHDNLDYNTGTKYEIAIGGWANTQSVIVKGIQSTQMDLHVESGMLSCTEFRPFWLSWDNSIITVGKGSIVGSHEILRWTPSPPMLFNFVSYSSYINSPGIWYFLVQS